MELKSIHLQIPDSHPFDRDCWFECFLGYFVKPLVETNLIESYWFSRYLDEQLGKHVRFRMKTNSYGTLEEELNTLLLDLKLKDLGDEKEYDGGEFRGERFVGESRRNIQPEIRQDLIWDFLQSAAKLHLDTLSHIDGDGYWVRETNHDRGNNIDGDTMESIHHLFCNLTDVRPRVDVLAGLDQSGGFYLKAIAGHYRKWGGIPDHLVRASERVNF